MRNASGMILLAAAIIATGCGGKKPPEQPAPQPQAPPPSQSAEDEAARAKARQDSIDAAARAMAEKQRQAEQRAAQLRASLMQDMAAMIHFEFDKSDILSEDVTNLDRKAAILRANGSLHIRIAGHCDERGSDEYNLALGNRRAASAKRYLVNKGTDAGRIEVVSYGEERPIDPGHDETAWAKNRRDEFEILAGGDNLVAP